MVGFTTPSVILFLVHVCCVLVTSLHYHDLEAPNVARSVFTQGINKHFHGALRSAFPAPNNEGAHDTVTTLDESAATYLPAGYAYVSLSNDASDSTCEKSSISVGIPANTCMAEQNYAFKIQLVEDGCNGAMVQYFGDVNCTTFVQEVPLDLGQYADCNEYTGETTFDLDGISVTAPIYYWKLHCTAQPSKPINVASTTLDLFDGAGSCTNYAGFVSFAQDACFVVGSGMMSLGPRCSATDVTLTQYWGSTCSIPIPFAPSPFADTCALMSAGLPLTTHRTRRSLRGGGLRVVSLDSNHGNNNGNNGNNGGGSNHGGGGGSNEHDDGSNSTGDDVDGFPGHEDDDHSRSDDGHNHGHGEHDDDHQHSSGGSDDGGVGGLIALPDLTSYLASCTAPNTNYGAIVSVTHTIQTVTDIYGSFLLDPAAYMTVLQKSVADSINVAGVSYTDVYISGITSTAAPSLTAAPQHGAHFATTGAMAGSSVYALQVLYTVLAYSDTLDNAGLAAALQRAVDIGSFDDLLHVYAQEEGAVGFVDANSAALQVTALSGGNGDQEGINAPPPKHPTGGSDNTGSGGGSRTALSQGTLIGIAVGGGLGLLLLVTVLVRWCWPSDKTATATVTASPASADTANATATATATAIGGGGPRAYGVQYAVYDASDFEGTGKLATALPWSTTSSSGDPSAPPMMQVILLAEHLHVDVHDE